MDKSEKELRARFKVEAPDHPAKDSRAYQSVVREEDPDTGEVKAVWMGKSECKTQRDAIKIGKVWIDAEVGRLQRLEILSGRRRDELPELLEKNHERTEDLTGQKKDITAAIASVREENVLMIRETCHPEISIVMYEGTGTFAYTFKEKGKLVEVDDRQLGLFTEGVVDDAPDIHDMTSEDDQDEAAE